MGTGLAARFFVFAQRRRALTGRPHPVWPAGCHLPNPSACCAGTSPFKGRQGRGDLRRNGTRGTVLLSHYRCKKWDKRTVPPCPIRSNEDFVCRATPQKRASWVFDFRTMAGGSAEKTSSVFSKTMQAFFAESTFPRGEGFWRAKGFGEKAFGERPLPSRRYAPRHLPLNRQLRCLGKAFGDEGTRREGKALGRCCEFG